MFGLSNDEGVSISAQYDRAFGDKVFRQRFEQWSVGGERNRDAVLPPPRFFIYHFNLVVRGQIATKFASAVGASVEPFDPDKHSLGRRDGNAFPNANDYLTVKLSEPQKARPGTETVSVPYHNGVEFLTEEVDIVADVARRSFCFRYPPAFIMDSASYLLLADKEYHDMIHFIRWRRPTAPPFR